MTIESLRRKIDSIDRKLILLLSRRMSYSGKIGSLKSRKGRPVIDKTREKTLLEKVRVQAGKSGLDEKWTVWLIKRIILKSRQSQKS